jgi:hypothetical protein
MVKRSKWMGQPHVRKPGAGATTIHGGRAAAAAVDAAATPECNDATAKGVQFEYTPLLVPLPP